MMTFIISREGFETVILRTDGENIYKIKGGGAIAEKVKNLIETGDRRNRLPHVFLLEELDSLSRETKWEVVAY